MSRYKVSGPISAVEKSEFYVKEKCQKECETKREMRKERENLDLVVPDILQMHRW